jgi:NagD protein
LNDTNEKKNYLIDMDGVLVRGQAPIAGAAEFIARLRDGGHKFMVLTNNPLYTTRDLSYRLRVTGLEIEPERIYTSAMATAQFIQNQKPDGTAYVVGESGLTHAIYETGYVITDRNPDYVVLGETHAYSIDQITMAIRLVAAGAHFIATNPDKSGPSEHGIVPACGAMAALVEQASGRRPLFIGKPNPLMMRLAMNHLGVHSEDTIMIGDNMETDIIAGVQSGLDTILVLSGITDREHLKQYPFQPTQIVNSVAEIEP